MTRVVCFTAGGVALAASLLAARPARAQVMCNDATLLPNPIIVTGSNTFEPIVGQFAVKLAAEPSPSSVVFATAAATSCAGIASVADAMDLAGSPGRYYTLSGTAVTRNDCLFAAGQKADVAVSDVFYESCANRPQPKPADIADVTGPVEASVFVVPALDTATQYLTSDEAAAIYGCGVSSTRPIAGFADPNGVFCRNPDAGPQMIIAKSLGLAPTALISPKCSNGGSSTGAMAGNVSSFDDSTSLTTRAHAIGFISADALEGLRVSRPLIISDLAFQARGQTRAYSVDSAPTVPDRLNVRDGHYTIWGYLHLLAKTSGGNPNRQAADFIGWLTGSKSSANFDSFSVAVRAGLIPQCAMRVKRSSDGGLLSPYTTTQPCRCAFEAATTKVMPAGCQFCSSDSMCTGGSVCRRGFCE